MTTHIALWLFSAISFSVFVAGCQWRWRSPSDGEGAPAFALSDSLRGVLLETGFGAEPVITLRSGSERLCTLIGDVGQLRAAVGLEVVAWGRSSPSSVPPAPDGTQCAFEVEDYAVRGADGVGAVDGILRAEDRGFVLYVTRGRRVQLEGVPDALQRQVGARIFWVGPTNQPPIGYGVLRPAARP